VPPAGGVEGGAGKVGEARQVGEIREVDPAHGRDHDAGGEPPAVSGPEPPMLAGLVPGQLLDGGAEPGVAVDLVLAGHPLDVAENFRLRRVDAGPLRQGGKRIRVEPGGHVAGAAWIGVVPPGAAQGRSLLEDGEVLPAILE